MKSKIVIISLLFLSLFLSGCIMKKASKSDSNATSPTEEKITNISDALKSTKKIICTYKDSQGIESKIYIDNGKYKTEYTENGKTQYSFFYGTYYYYWTEGDNKGYKISHECLDELIEGDNSSPGPTSGSEGSVNDEVNNYQTEDDLKNTSETSCQTVSSVDISLPENATFTDQCEILKEAKKAMKDIEGKVNDIFDKAP